VADFKVKIDGVEQSASDGIKAIDYYKDKNDQQYKPSKTGICLSKEQWEFIKQHKDYTE
jgi:hypothetical protein